MTQSRARIESECGSHSDPRLVKVVPPGSGRESHILFERARSGETIRDVQVKRVRKDGSLVDVRLAAAPMYNADGTVRGIAWAVEDITPRRPVAKTPSIPLAGFSFGGS
jgi:PAS domain S-box-containing protein